MSSDVKSLSCQLYDVMEEVGASENMRLLARQTATSVEIYQAIVFDVEQGRAYICGSRFEGSMVLETFSDSDNVFYATDHRIIEEQQESVRDKELLIVQDMYTFPGYVKLQDVRNKRPVTIHSMLSHVKEYMSTYSDMLRFIQTNRDIDCLGRICIKPMPVEEKHGPASKYVNEKGIHLFDRVLAIPCQRVPDFANGWMTRRKRYEWPSEQQVRVMSEMGCLLVGVGHESSAESDIEWRLSFTRQERLLMASLNPTQHKAYILLKIIKKERLQPLFGNKFPSSYHLKTLVLHTVENTPLALWTKDNLTNCVTHCLNTLYGWVRNGVCPNYFMKDQNLFSKFVLRRMKRRLMKELHELLRLKHTLFSNLRTSGIGPMLSETGFSLWHTEAIHRTSTLKLMLLMAITSSDILLGLPETDKKLKRSHGISLLKYLLSVKTVSDHTEKETKTSLSFLIPWVQLHTAKQILSDALCKLGESGKYNSISVAFKHLKRASPTDLVQVNLAKASYYFMQNRFDDCLSLLIRAETNLAKSTFSICCCFQGKVHSVKDLDSYGNIYAMSWEQIANRMVGCVTFPQCQKELAPFPLALEMKRWILVTNKSEKFIHQCLYENAIVDAVVYLHFLKYLVSEKLDKPDIQLSALANLQRDTKYDDLGHQDTAYNLLGWIYSQENRIGEAIQCFMESWRIRPEVNAALFHMNSMSDFFDSVIRNWERTPSKT